MATRQPDRAISMTTLFCTPHPKEKTPPQTYRIEFYLKTRRNHHHHHHHHHHRHVKHWTFNLSDTPAPHSLSLVQCSVLSLKDIRPTSVSVRTRPGDWVLCPLPRSQELNLWFSAHKAHKLGSQGPGGVQQCPHRLVTYTHKYCTLTSSFVQHNEDYC